MIKIYKYTFRLLANKTPDICIVNLQLDADDFYNVLHADHVQFINW